jgi:hypothetical protein
MGTRLSNDIWLGTIMTVLTAPTRGWIGLAVIERGNPTGRLGMTAGAITLRVSRYMSGRLCLRILSNISTTVTTVTLTCRTGMIHDRRRERRSALVATVAISIHRKEIGWDVAGRLGQCTGVSIQATVTRRTGQRRHYTVVHPCR